MALIYLDEIAERVNAKFFYAQGITGKGVKIAVLDSGVNSSHPMLSGKVYFKKQIAVGNMEGSNDIHGTFVSSIAAGKSVTSSAMSSATATLLSYERTFSGIAYGAQIANIKVLDDEGNASHSDITEGIYTAIDSGADIINMSLGSDYDDAGESPVSRAVDYASSLGKIVVVSAGNSLTPYTPATANTAIAVGSNTLNSFVSSYSSRGPARNKSPYPTLTTIGGEDMPENEEYIVAAGHDTYYGMVGTSFACPVVSGVMALYLEYMRRNGMALDWNSAMRLIANNVKDIPPLGIDSDSGYGELLVRNAELSSQEPMNGNEAPVIVKSSSSLLPFLLLSLGGLYGIFVSKRRKR